MKVLLVRPMPHPDSIGLHKLMVCEPLELEYASAVLKAAGHEVELADLILDRRPFGRILEESAPDLVGFTAYLPHVGTVRALASEAKAALPSALTMVAGVHAEVVPQDFDDPGIDFVLHANALTSLADLAAGLAAGRRPEELRREIPGVWDGSGKECELDASGRMPRPDRELSARYRRRYNYIFHERCALVKTSFGCPYTCDFCFCARITRGKWFGRELEDVVDEIAAIAERNVFMVDDDFLIDRSRVERFCALLDARGVRKRFILFGRADFVAQNPDTIRLLRDHGARAIFVGIESFADSELEGMNKLSSVELNLRAVRVLEELGMECYAGIIVDPDWDRADFAALRERLREIQRPFLNIQPLTPMPGTPAWDRLASRIAVPREAWQLWDMAHLVIRPARLDPAEFYRELLDTYWAASVRPHMHWYILSRYGPRIWLRTVRGAMHITRQYRRLIRSPGLPVTVMEASS
jgi:radical SAM superfamily enzyme YgiQ (UPF0313 family)